MDVSWLKTGALLLIGASLYAGLNGDLQTQNLSLELPQTSEYQKASVRDIVNNPVKYEGKKVLVEGKSNSFQDFISSGGYTLNMDCSQYSNFRYATPSGFEAKGIIELENPGESGPRLRCLEPPKALD